MNCHLIHNVFMNLKLAFKLLRLARAFSINCSARDSG